MLPPQSRGFGSSGPFTDLINQSINQSINKSTLFNEGDTQQSSTDKPVALEFLIELEFRNVGF